MTIRELIELIDEERSICIEDFDKPIDVTELYCGAVGALMQRMRSKNEGY